VEQGQMPSCQVIPYDESNQLSTSYILELLWESIEFLILQELAFVQV
jgi:hypothetical protein